MSFDRLAQHYDWMEAVLAGRRLQRARVMWLEAIPEGARVLSVGEGHGRFAAACTAARPDVRLTCVDASGPMLDRARRRHRASGGSSAITWIEAKLPEWSPEAEAFDVIVTCFFLDCFSAPALAGVMAALGAAATASARWINVDFSVPDCGWRRARARAIHALMYAFFRVATDLPARRLVPPDGLLSGLGFTLRGRRELEWGLIRADLWQRLPGNGAAIAAA